MAVALDSVGPSSAGIGFSGPGAPGTTSPVTWTHTPVGTPTAVLVGVAVGTNAAGGDGTITVGPVTYGGVSMTSLGIVHANSSNAGYIQVFALASPPSGAQTVSVSFSGFSGTALNNAIECGSLAYTGTGATFATAFGTPATAFGNGASGSISVTGASASNRVAGFVVDGSGGEAATAGSLEYKNDQSIAAGAGGNTIGLDTASAAGTVTLSWTESTDWWGALAVELLALRYNTGTTATVTNSGTASGTVVIPAGVLQNDIILVEVMCFTTATGTITPTLSSSATAPSQLSSSPQSTGLQSGITTVTGLWTIKAGASDAGATLTFGATGGTGGSYWFNVGVVAYTGFLTAAPIDISAGTESFSSSGTGAFTTPSATTVANGDWQVQFGGIGPAGNPTLVTPGGLSLRQSIVSATNAGLLLAIADSNGSVGAAGSSIGNSSWTVTGSTAGNTWVTSYTVGLATQAAAGGGGGGAPTVALPAIAAFAPQPVRAMALRPRVFTQSSATVPGTVSLVGSITTATEVNTSGGATTIAPAAYAQSPTAGNLLVAVITRVGTTATASPTVTGASGWTRLLPTNFVTNIGVGSATACTNLVDIWYKAAAGGDAVPTFTMTLAGGSTTAILSCTVFELHGANTSTPLDVSGTFSSGGTSATETTITTTTSANVTAANEFAISVATRERTAGAPAITYSASWTNAFNDGATSQAEHTGVAFLANPASGSTASDVTTFSSTGTTAFGAGAIVVIKGASSTVNVPPALDNRVDTYTALGQVPPQILGTTLLAVNLAGAATLSGIGALTAQPSVNFTEVASLSGAGVLTAHTVVNFPSASALSGSGSLSASTTVDFRPATSLSGSGLLTAGATVDFRPLSSLTGSGLLTAARAVNWLQASTLSGLGVLTAQPVVNFVSGATLSGLGVLTAQPVVNFLPTVTLSGLGVLAASAATSGNVAATASLSGTGALTAQPVVNFAEAAVLSGTGVLAAQAVVNFIPAAILSGTGVLAAQPVVNFAGTIALTGRGVLTAQPVVNFIPGAVLSGTGILTAQSVVNFPGAAVLSGLGVLTASASVSGSLSESATLSGTGVLVAQPAVNFEVLAALSGTGVLTAQSVLSHPGLATLSGTGVLTAQSVVNFPGLAILSGAGSLTAQPVVGFKTLAGLSGLGTMTAGPVVNLTGASTLSGLGVLTATVTVAAGNFAGNATLFGAGVLTAHVVVNFPGTSALSGIGVLTATRPFIPGSTIVSLLMASFP